MSMKQKTWVHYSRIPNKTLFDGIRVLAPRGQIIQLDDITGEDPFSWVKYNAKDYDVYSLSTKKMYEWNGKKWLLVNNT